MKICTFILLAFVCGCGSNLVSMNEKTEQLKRLELGIERIDEIELTDGRLTQIDPVLRPEMRDKIAICHVTQSGKRKTLHIDRNDWEDHRYHARVITCYDNTTFTIRDTIGKCGLAINACPLEPVYP